VNGCIKLFPTFCLQSIRQLLFRWQNSTSRTEIHRLHYEAIHYPPEKLHMYWLELVVLLTFAEIIVKAVIEKMKFEVDILLVSGRNNHPSQKTKHVAYTYAIFPFVVPSFLVLSLLPLLELSPYTPTFVPSLYIPLSFLPSIPLTPHYLGNVTSFIFISVPTTCFSISSRTSVLNDTPPFGSWNTSSRARK